MPIVVDEKFGKTARPLTAVDVTFILISYELAQLVAPVFVLPMLTSFGRKKSALIGLGIDALCCALFSLTTFITVGEKFLYYAIAMRLIIGAASALAKTPTGALLIENARKDEFEQVNGIYMACEGVGLTLGPSLYAVLFDMCGFPFTMLIMSLQNILCLMFFAWTVEENLTDENEERVSIRPTNSTN